MKRSAAGLVLVATSALVGTARAGDSPSACAAEVSFSQDRFARGEVDEMQVQASMGDGLINAFLFNVAAFTPTVGIQVQRGRDLPAASLAWSASLPFGPMTACRKNGHSGDLYGFRPLRVIMEGGVVLRSPGWSYLRPGLRAIWHRSDWRVGFGAGVGSTVALMPGENGAASVSPELLVHCGRCCAFGYWMLTLRADTFFPRRYATTATASVAIAFW